MSRFVTNPNLPDSEVVLAAVGIKYCSTLEQALSEQGIELIPVPLNPSLDTRLQSHADLSLLHIKSEFVITALETSDPEFLYRLDSEGFRVSESDKLMRREYPGDCGLNVCIARKYCICNRKAVSEEIITKLNDKGLTPNYVNQGYSKCSTCIVDKRSVITSDRGIADTMRNLGFDVLLISNGGIILDGFDYGFIGGSAFLSSPDRICFTGDFRNFTDDTEKRVMSFLESRKINHTFLTNTPMFDIGGIIQLKEKEN